MKEPTFGMLDGSDPGADSTTVFDEENGGTEGNDHEDKGEPGKKVKDDHVREVAKK